MKATSDAVWTIAILVVLVPMVCCTWQEKPLSYIAEQSFFPVQLQNVAPHLMSGPYGAYRLRYHGGTTRLTVATSIIKYGVVSSRVEQQSVLLDGTSYENLTFSFQQHAIAGKWELRIAHKGVINVPVEKPEWAGLYFHELTLPHLNEERKKVYLEKGQERNIWAYVLSDSATIPDINSIEAILENSRWAVMISITIEKPQ